MLMVQTHDYQGATTQQAMTAEIKQLIANMLRLSHAGRQLDVTVPVDLIEFVENARNPDIYTRQFVEEAMRLNQELKGKSDAFADFRDILGREMMSAMPDIKDDVKAVVLASGGRVDT